MHLYCGSLYQTTTRGFDTRVRLFVNKELMKTCSPYAEEDPSLLHIILTKGCAESFFGWARARMLVLQLAITYYSQSHRLVNYKFSEENKRNPRTNKSHNYLERTWGLKSGDPSLLSSITPFKPGDSRPQFSQL